MAATLSRTPVLGDLAQPAKAALVLTPTVTNFPLSRQTRESARRPSRKFVLPRWGYPRSAVQFFIMGVRDSEKDRLALSVADRHADFEAALAANRRKYPIPEFRLFAEAVRNYVEKVAKRRYGSPGRSRSRQRTYRRAHGRTKTGAGRSALRGRQTGMPRFPRLRPEFRWGRTPRSLSCLSAR